MEDAGSCANEAGIRQLVHHLWRLVQKLVVGQLLEHELCQVGSREAQDEGPGSEMLTASLATCALSIGQHGPTDDDPLQMTLLDHPLIEFVILATVAIKFELDGDLPDDRYHDRNQVQRQREPDAPWWNRP